jgi:hypothetical protein
MRVGHQLGAEFRSGGTAVSAKRAAWEIRNIAVEFVWDAFNDGGAILEEGLEGEGNCGWIAERRVRPEKCDWGKTWRQIRGADRIFAA